MTKFEKQSSMTRRAVLLGGGALVVSVGAAVSLDTVLSMQTAQAQGTAKPPLMPDELSSFIAVNADGSVAAYFGKMDMGHGLHVAIGQMVAEELDVDFKRVTVIMGDTATSVNQGGASGSTGIQLGGRQMRMAAAEARRVLVEMAAGLLTTPADKLVVDDGIVSVAHDATKRITYAEMIGGRYFNVKLAWNKQYGNALYAPGKAQPKKPSEYKIVGQSDQARGRGAQGVRAGELRHRRQSARHGARPHDPPAGCRQRAGQSGRSARSRTFRGAQVVWDKGFLGVVADKEWDAIKAAEKLKVEWSAAAAALPRPSQALRSHPPGARAQARGGQAERRRRRGFRARRSKLIEAEYEWPFQSHASMGPACALVEIKDGHVTCWSGTQKSHYRAAGAGGHARRAAR